MKHFIFLFLLVNLNIIFSQQPDAYSVSRFKTCKEAKVAAKIDFEKEKIWSDEGLQYFDVQYSSDYILFFETYFFSKYNIEFYLPVAACLTTSEMNCYAKETHRLILKKFGKDFFEVETKKAEHLFKELNRNDYSNIVNFEKRFYSLESYPKFIGNDKVIIEYIEKLFEDLDPKELEYTLDFDINGKLTEIQFKYEGKRIETPNKPNIIDEINALGDWVPGYLFGKKVKSRMKRSLTIY